MFTVYYHIYNCIPLSILSLKTINVQQNNFVQIKDRLASKINSILFIRWVITKWNNKQVPLSLPFIGCIQKELFLSIGIVWLKKSHYWIDFERTFIFSFFNSENAKVKRKISNQFSSIGIKKITQQTNNLNGCDTAIFSYILRSPTELIRHCFNSKTAISSPEL